MKYAEKLKNYIGVEGHYHISGGFTYLTLNYRFEHLAKAKIKEIGDDFVVLSVDQHSYPPCEVITPLNHLVLTIYKKA